MTVFKVKWHWIAGGACALLFIVLLTIRLGFFESEQEKQTKGTDDTVPRIVAYRDRETWMNISQNGRKIGHAHRHFSRTEKGYRVVESVFMRINTMGVVQGLTFKTEGNLHSDMSLSSFDFVLRSSLFHFKVRGMMDGKKLTLYTEMPGSEKKSVMVLRETPHLSTGMIESADVAGMKPGEKKIFSVFDPSSMGQRPVTLAMIGEEALTAMGRTQTARKVAVNFMGVRQFAWIGEDGDVLKEQGILGITLEQVAKHEALSGFDLAASADLTEIASVPSNVIIDDPGALSSMKVRITNIEKASFYLDGERQSFRKNVLLVQKETIPMRPLRSTNVAGNMAYLASTPFVQSDHWKIRAKVQEIISPEDPVAVKASKLVSWVHKNVEKRPVLSIPNAVETLANLVGDCNEHAVLLAALARAAGIPAQVEAGLVYQRGRFYYHAWNVLYLGTWITADAVMGQMPADVTHLRFVRGEADQQIDLIGVIGNVRIKVLDKSR